MLYMYADLSTDILYFVTEIKNIVTMLLYM